jgi:uncharacterized delta-60 repeat protein
LDTTFAGDGKLVLRHPNPDGGVRRLEGVALQPDGKIVVVGGIWTVYAARLNPDGSLDTTFDGDGWQTVQYDASNPQSGANDVSVQSDGKIVIAGYSGEPHRLALARLNADGSLDAEAAAVTLTVPPEPQGATVLTTKSAIAATAGDLDPTFGGDGFVTAPVGTSANANAAAVQADGKILVAGRTLNSRQGRDFAVARFRPDGTLDSTFGNGGAVITAVSKNTGEANALLLQNGKIIVGGWADLNNGPFVSDFDRAFALVRYNANGSLDSTFGGKGKGGKVYTQLSSSSRDERLNDLAFQGTKIIAVGVSSGNIALARYDSEGRLDTTFGNSGTKIIDLGGSEEAIGVVVQPDGRIVVAGAGSNSGTQDIVLIRLNSDGRTLDNSFGAGGVVVTDIVINGESQHNFAKDIVLAADGKLVVTGLGQVARYNSDGSLDSTFGQDYDGNGVRDGFDTDGSGEELVIDAQQRIVIGGTWASPDSQNPADPWDADFAVVRFAPNGDLDSTFGAGGVVVIDASGTNAEHLTAIALQTDGKIVAAGWSDASPGGFAVARLLSDPAVGVSNSEISAARDGGAAETKIFALAVEQLLAEEDAAVLRKRKVGAFSR